MTDDSSDSNDSPPPFPLTSLKPRSKYSSQEERTRANRERAKECQRIKSNLYRISRFHSPEAIILGFASFILQKDILPSIDNLKKARSFLDSLS